MAGRHAAARPFFERNRMSDTDPGPMLNDVQASRLLGITPFALRQWRYRHQGPPYVKLGTCVRYRRDDLLSFIADHARLPTREFNRAA